MDTPFHKILLQWHNKYLDHRVEKVPIPHGVVPNGFEYNYYLSNFLEGLGYYDSEFVCPFCPDQIADDGSLIYNVLYGLEIKASRSLIEDSEVELKRLFTCPRCHAFYATIASIGGEKLYGRSGSSPYLDEFAVYTPMYSEDAWIDIVEQTKSLTCDPSIYDTAVIDPAFIEVEPAFAALKIKDESPLSEARKESLLADAIDRSCTSFLAYREGSLPYVYIHQGDIKNAHVLMDKEGIFKLIDELFETNVVSFLDHASESDLNEWDVQRLKEIIHSIAFDYCEEGEKVCLEQYIDDDALLEKLSALDWSKEPPDRLLKFLNQ